MNTKIAVVTGANKGIGFEVVKKLCTSGFKTILACRNEALGTAAANELKLLGHDVEFRQLDISDAGSINLFKEGMLSNYGHIDILVNNAAIAFKAADPTPPSLQARPTVSVNYYGTIRVTEALLPLLLKAASSNINNSFKPRIVNVASLAGHLKILKSDELRAKFASESLSLSDLNGLMDKFVADAESSTLPAAMSEKGWPSSNYGTSKLGVIALTKVLARQFPQLLCNCCCPGYCATDMSSHKGTQSAADGAKTVAHAALLSDDASTSGVFFENEQISTW